MSLLRDKVNFTSCLRDGSIDPERRGEIEKRRQTAFVGETEENSWLS